MNRNTVKYIAAFTMFLDHLAIGVITYGSFWYTFLRILGRISFVLFAYMIAEGFFHTKNLKNYFLRLFGFAAMIELFILGYLIVSKENYLLEVNVIWPLVFGLGGLILLKQKSIWIRLLVIPLVFLAEISKIPYGAYGTLLILFFGIYTNKVTQLMFLVALNLLFIDVPLLNFAGLSDYARYTGDMWIQWFSLLGMIFIFLYNGSLGKHRTKAFFYIFFPLHLGIIYLISLFV